MASADRLAWRPSYKTLITNTFFWGRSCHLRIFYNDSLLMLPRTFSKSTNSVNSACVVLCHSLAWCSLSTNKRSMYDLPLLDHACSSRCFPSSGNFSFPLLEILSRIMRQNTLLVCGSHWCLPSLVVLLWGRFSICPFFFPLSPRFAAVVQQLFGVSCIFCFQYHSCHFCLLLVYIFFCFFIVYFTSFTVLAGIDV